jgi:hypothetical protein
MNSSVSVARRLVNTSGMVRAIDLKFSHVKDMGLSVGMDGSTAVPQKLWWQKVALKKCACNALIPEYCILQNITKYYPKY